ncbi:MAG: SOS response-associated peptidase [Candidatus Dadabacteria bacterium]|nr:SOS response-associated peptidase [Candidatus Dadabacteria bacterium]NIQ14639.1 SOS response-associated peptidase [Candidatus Dadabacteria bacterium]
MCGRFSLASEIDEIMQQFTIIDEPFDDVLKPRYNIAPSQLSPVVVNEDGKNKLKMFKWGLVPPWSKDTRIGFRMINARAETVEEKPSFKKPFKSQRCLVIADGFYEWKKQNNKKQPYRFVTSDGKPFAMAGLWEAWKKEAEPLYTFTIITTDNNELMEPVHDRMPVILPRTNQEIWMNLESNEAELKELLVPYDSNKMEYYRVSDIVNSWKNDVPECIMRI